MLKLKEIKRLLSLAKKNLSQNGKILILTLDADKNELPTFKLMRTRLNKSLKRDKRILKLIKHKLISMKKSKRKEIKFFENIIIITKFILH